MSDPNALETEFSVEHNHIRGFYDPSHAEHHDQVAALKSAFLALQKSAQAFADWYRESLNTEPDWPQPPEFDALAAALSGRDTTKRSGGPMPVGHVLTGDTEPGLVLPRKPSSQMSAETTRRIPLPVPAWMDDTPVNRERCDRALRIWRLALERLKAESPHPAEAPAQEED